MPATNPPPANQPIVPPNSSAQTPLGRLLSGATGQSQPGGPLTYTPPTTLAGTAAAAGLPANMSSPATAASLGASPDAAKMAGTPAAFAGALGLGGGAPASPLPAAPASAATPASLSAGDRSGAFQANAAQTSNQAARQAKQEQLKQEFGSVGLRVESLVAGAVQQAAAPGSAPTYSTPTTDDPRFQGKDPTAVAAAKAALTALATAPGDQNAYVAAQKALAAAGLPATGPGADPLSYLTQSTGAQAAAAGIEHQINLTPATMSSIGLTPQDLTDLGLDPAKASTYTIAQLRDAIGAAATQTGVIGTEAAAAASGLGGVGQSRALQRDVSAAQSQSGYSAEAAAQQTLGRALQGETISIGGSDYKIEDLLNSDKFTTLASAYLQAPPDSDLRKQLDAQMPSLGKYIQDNQTALTAAVQKVTAAAGGTQSAEASNLDTVQKLATSTGLTVDQVRQTYGDLIPGLGDEFTTTKADPSKSGVLAVLMGASLGVGTGPDGKPQNVVADPAAMHANLTALKASDPAAYAALASMTPAQLAATGVTGQNADAKQQFASLQAKAAETKAHANDTAPQLLQYLFGTNNPQAALNSLIAQSALTTDRETQDHLTKVISALDPSGSGVALQDAGSLGRLQSLLAQGSLSDMLKQTAAGKPVVGGSADIGYSAPVQGSLSKALGDALAASKGPLNTYGAASIAVRTDPADTAHGVDSVELEQAIPQLSHGDPAVKSQLEKQVEDSKKNFVGWKTTQLSGVDPHSPDPAVASLAKFLNSPTDTRDAATRAGDVVISSQFGADSAGAAISALQRVRDDPHADKQLVDWQIAVLQQKVDAWHAGYRPAPQSAASSQYQPGQVAITQQPGAGVLPTDGKPSQTLVGAGNSNKNNAGLEI